MKWMKEEYIDEPLFKVALTKGEIDYLKFLLEKEEEIMKSILNKPQQDFIIVEAKKYLEIVKEILRKIGGNV